LSIHLATKDDSNLPPLTEVAVWLSFKGKGDV